MTVKLLTEHHLEFVLLKGGCAGSSESTHVKMPHCWQGFPGLKIESLRLPKCCLGLSNNNLEGSTGLSKIEKEFTI